MPNDPRVRAAAMNAIAPLTQFQLMGDDDVDACLELIFIHGIGGHPAETWTHPTGGYWPAWFTGGGLPVAVYSLGYPTSIPLFGPGGEFTLQDRADAMLQYLLDRRDWRRPVLVVAHSLGGLLVKAMIRRDVQVRRASTASFADRLRGVAFIGTPHLGADLARVAASNRFISQIVSPAVLDMARNTPDLAVLHGWYEAFAVYHAHFRGKVYWEGNSLAPFRKGGWLRRLGFLFRHKVVARETGAPVLPNHDRPVALDGDHIEIAKLQDRGAPLYLGIRKWVEEHLRALLPAAGPAGRTGAGIARGYVPHVAERSALPYAGGASARVREVATQLAQQVSLALVGDEPAINSALLIDALRHARDTAGARTAYLDIGGERCGDQYGFMSAMLGYLDPAYDGHAPTLDEFERRTGELGATARLIIGIDHLDRLAGHVGFTKEFFDSLHALVNTGRLTVAAATQVSPLALRQAGTLTSDLVERLTVVPVAGRRDDA